MDDKIMDFRNMEKKGMGETPDDIQEKCLKLCQDYLGGHWLKQTKDSITVKRLTGGMLNQLYYCAINDTISGNMNGTTDEDRDVPKEVAIKLTQKKPFIEVNETEEKTKQLSELMVTLLMSENGLGPKVYGVFEGGIIVKYYRQEPFTVKLQENEGLVREIFEKLARLHAMEPPINRNTKLFFFEWLDDNYKLAVEMDFFDDAIRSGHQSFKDNDFHGELKWIKDLAHKAKSPVVFTHNDYRSDNIMVLKDGNEESDGKRVVVCDYDFAMYGNRAMDFLHLIKEWGNENAFFDRQNVYYPPEDSLTERLLQYYFDESVRIFGEQWAENPLNSIKHLILELKVYWLYFQFTSILPFLNMLDEKKDLPPQALMMFGGKRPDKAMLMKMADHGYGNYLKLKNKLIDQVNI